MTEQDEEEEVTTTQRGRPNAYFARIKAEQEEELEQREHGDTFSGDFRGTRPAPRGGAAHVRPDHTLGTDELCWCGQPLGHDWPGKSVGAKHPKESNVSVDTGTLPNLDRKDLRAYHRRLQDFIVNCVNVEGLRYRMTKNSVLLFPNDGTSPMSVYARNTDRQLRQLQKWYIEHVYQAEEVTPEEIRRLADAKNNPAEHPKAERPAEIDAITVNAPAEHPQYQDTPADPEEYLPPVSTDEWHPYVTNEGVTSPRIVTNGTRWRCTDCANTDHPLDSDNIRSVGGHNRIYHTDTSNLRSDEAKQKAVETRRANLIANSKINQAIELLIDFAGYELPQADTAELEALTMRVTDAEARASQALKDMHAAEERAEVAEKRAEELETKLALIREATGL